MSARPLTVNERALLVPLVGATFGGRWFRARRQGEAVTLASLYRKGLAVRRCHRGAEGDADAAHEYQAHPILMDEARPMLERAQRAASARRRT